MSQSSATMRYVVGAIGLVLAAMALVYCGTPHCDCGGDAGNPCPGTTPVIHGASCSSDDAGACGYAANCGHVGYDKVTTCVCANGRWDCNVETCPHCADPTIIGASCSSSWCTGPTHAQLCDGEIETVGADAECSCTALGWVCNGVTAISCEAGADAASTD